MNVMWVVAQVLGYADPNFDVYELPNKITQGQSAVISHGPTLWIMTARTVGRTVRVGRQVLPSSPNSPRRRRRVA